MIFPNAANVLDENKEVVVRKTVVVELRFNLIVGIAAPATVAEEPPGADTRKKLPEFRAALVVFAEPAI